MELNQFRDVDLVVDKANDNFIQRQFVSQGDYKGRTMTVQVTDNGLIGKVIGLTLNLRWQNQASGLADLTAFECIDQANSVFRIEYPKHMMTPGKVVANIQVIQNGQVTHLKTFEMTVQTLAGEMTGIVGKAEYGALVAVLADANKFRTDIDTLGMDKADKASLSNTNQRVDGLTANKVDKGGAGQVGWGMLAQDARDNISGNKVATVGPNSVGTVNMIDNSVTTSKIVNGSVTSDKRLINIYPTDLSDWSFSRYSFTAGEKSEYILPANTTGDYYRHDTARLIDVSKRTSDKIYFSNELDPDFKIAVHQFDENEIGLSDSGYVTVGFVTLSATCAYIRLVVSRIDGSNFNLDIVPDLLLKAEVGLHEYEKTIVEEGNILAINTDTFEVGGISYSETDGTLTYSDANYLYRLKRDTFIDASKYRKLYSLVNDGYHIFMYLLDENLALTFKGRWIDNGSSYIPDLTKKATFTIRRDDYQPMNSSDLEKIKVYLSPVASQKIIRNNEDVLHDVDDLIAWKKSNWADLVGDIKYIGHAGTTYFAPENTLEAYYVSSLMGHWGAECDLAVTKDSQLILMHDYTLDRTTTGIGNVADYTLEEIKSFTTKDDNIWGPCQIPTFEEYLLFCKKNKMYPIVELKDNADQTEMVDLVMEALSRVNMLDSVILISFSQSVLNKIRGLNKTIKIARLLKTTEAVSEYFGNVGINMPAGIVVYKDQVTKDGIDLLKAKGVTVLVWTVDDVDESNDLEDLGVDMIITNRVSDKLKPSRLFSNKIYKNNSEWVVKPNASNLPLKITGIDHDLNALTIRFERYFQKTIATLKPRSLNCRANNSNYFLNVNSQISSDGTLILTFIGASGVLDLESLENGLELSIDITF